MPSNLIKSIAAIAVVFHHWLLFLESESSSMSGVIFALTGISGTFVQLFFVISGYGLFFSYYKNPRSWKQWVIHRMRKILLPYWITVVITFILAILVHQEYTWQTLSAYLTLTRNFYSPGWNMNISLWFMPVLAGLYLSFPFLVKAIKAYGSVKIFILAAIISYSYIFTCISFGTIPEHQNAFFLSYLIQFTFGMALAHLNLTKSPLISFFYTKKGFVIGACVYFISALLAKNTQIGSTLNDFLNAFGLTAIFLSGGKLLQRVNQWQSFVNISGVSYLIYLIHAPIINFLIKPIWDNHIPSMAMLFSGIIFTTILPFLIYQVSLLWEKALAFVTTVVTDR